MGKVKGLKIQIQELTAAELAAFPFAKFEADNGDRKFEANLRAEKRDTLAKRALRGHRAGCSIKL